MSKYLQVFLTLVTSLFAHPSANNPDHALWWAYWKPKVKFNATETQAMLVVGLCLFVPVAALRQGTFPLVMLALVSCILAIAVSARFDALVYSFSGEGFALGGFTSITALASGIGLGMSQLFPPLTIGGVAITVTLFTAFGLMAASSIAAGTFMKSFELRRKIYPSPAYIDWDGVCRRHKPVRA
jgi:hypothetical protein